MKLSDHLRVCVGLLALAAFSAQADKLQYNRDIRPILSDRCFKCHGPDSGSRKAKLRLDQPESAFGPRKNPEEHAIVPGQPEKSLLVRRIFTSDQDDLMPPASSHLELSDAEKKMLREWIAQGAKYEPHWAFVPPPAKVAAPAVKNTKWPRNEIDRFVLARLEKAGMAPSPEASKERWIRRVTYDLNGLPPTPGEIDAFLADQSASAYETVVDRLLASRHFGERMAVPWLDAARYADSYGYQSDQLSPTWPYRDWVVEALNENMPYDEFLREQLAGDLLPHATRKQRLATAFNRLHRQTNEGGSVEEEWRNEYVSDRVQTFSSVCLGLTFECARCHDHKFDPITQRDYYSLGAFFNSIDEYGLYNDTPHVPTPSILLPNAEQEKSMTATAQDLGRANAALRRAISNAETSFHQWFGDSNIDLESPGLVGHFNADMRGATNLSATNTVWPVHLTGDDPLIFTNFPATFEPWSQYSVLLRVRLPAALTNGVIFHNSEGTDVGFHGTEVTLVNDRLFFAIKRFWPGNAIAVRSVTAVPHEKWTQIGATYDGSGRAEGLKLYVDGKPAAVEILRDHLEKSPECGTKDVSFGARMRSFGLKDAELDDIRVYNRALADIEVAQIFDGRAIGKAKQDLDANALRPYYLTAISPGLKEAREARNAALKAYFEARNPVQETSVMEELPKPREAFLLARGRYDAPKTEATRVTRATPAFLPKFPANAPLNRLGLAEWLTQPNHPLTARVAVNRYWQMVFGRGLVATPENFGIQGAAPTHPELLDWLARDFVNSGWNTKALLRKMVLSATYRQDSALRPESVGKDPENLLLSRGPSQRLPAEMIRDTALAASGVLDDKPGGPPVSPYMPGDLWRESNDMSPAYHQSVGEDLYRRSLYTVWKRTAPMPDMIAFDAPGREVCLLKRNPTSTPQQAFVLLNDTQFVEAARVLAEKTIQGEKDRAHGINFAFRQFTGRTPSADETKLLVDLWSEEAAEFAKEIGRATNLLAVGEKKPAASLDPVELAAATEVVQAILSLDATVWKR